MRIQNLKKIAATGKMDNQFIGIKISDNQIEFHYPETYQLSEDDDGLRRDILAILRTVSLAKTRTSVLSSYNAQHNNDYVFPLGAYLWIINDYLSYGRYENREKVYQRGARGKIDWKRTMRSNPVISGGNIIYTDIISEKKSQKDNLLTEIYLFCVQKAVDAIGWLYGILRSIGNWMQHNSDSIYGTCAAPIPPYEQNELFTCKPGKLFIHFFGQNKNHITPGLYLIRNMDIDVRRCYFMDEPEKMLEWSMDFPQALGVHYFRIKMPENMTIDMDRVLCVEYNGTIVCESV